MITLNDGRSREALPIDPKLGEILELVGKHRLVICEAETGAGKTTRIAQAAILADPKLHVTMTQPRRNACRWNGRRIAAELGCQPGTLVGWRLAGESPKISKSTRLTLVVTQTLVNTIRKSGKLPEGLLVVDEAHERSLPVDLLLGLIHAHLASAVKTHILIMSATLNTEAFSKFFHDAPIVHVQGRCYPVEEHITPLSWGEHHTDGALRAAIQVKERFFAGDLYVESKVLTKGTVIVLLPGKGDIDLIMQGLLATDYPANRLQVLACHGQISAEEQNLAQTPVPAGVIRFICGTDILRSSVTVPETRGVIDSLQVKRRITDAKGVTHLDKIAVSQAEADQAKGRAGRTHPGFYMPISFQGEYNQLQQWPEPAILRESLGNIALQIASLGKSIRSFPFIDSPPQDKIELAMQRLKDLGALDKDESITEIGKMLAGIPLDPEQAKVLLVAHQLGVLEEAVIVSAVLEVEGFFLPKRAQKKEGDSNKSDFVAIVRAYRAFKAREKSLKRHPNRKKLLFDWCKKEGLNLKLVQVAEDKIQQIIEDLPFTKKVSFIEERSFNEVALTKALIAGKIDHIATFDRIGYFDKREYQGRLGEFKLSRNSFCSADSPLILVGGVRKIPIKGGSDSFALADLAVPLEAEWVMEILPHLCSQEFETEYDYEESLDQVVKVQKIYFQDFHIADKQVVAPSHIATEKLAKWLASEAFRSPRLASNPLAEILHQNASIRKQAAELNQRAGKNIFVGFTEKELKHYFLNKLSGANKIEDIQNLQVLLLPKLDEQLAQNIRLENPSTFSILEKDCQINYYKTPQARLYKSSLSPKEWQSLLAAELPGGRKVGLKIDLPGRELSIQCDLDGKVHLKKQPLFELDMQGLQLDEADLSEANLSGTNLTGSSLSKTCLFRIVFNNQTQFPFDDIPFHSSAPYFIDPNELSTLPKLTQTLDRLEKLSSGHQQICYIQKCVAIQVVEHAKQVQSPNILSFLYNHNLMKTRGLLSAFSALSSLFTSTPVETSSQIEIRLAISQQFPLEKSP